MDDASLRIVITFFLFAAQHSLTVSDPLKNLLIRIMGERAFAGRFRLLFTLWNLLLFFLLLFYWRGLPDRALFTPAPILTGALHGTQILGLWVLYRAGKKIDLLHFIGVRQWKELRRCRPLPAERLLTTGIYGRVRHPIYLGSILVLWGEPHLLKTANGLLFVILITAYFVIGSTLEERRMVRQFGEEYRRYRKKAGWLWPKFRDIAP